MDLGRVRRKMARTNCECINTVKTVNVYIFFKTLVYRRITGLFFTVRKLYIDAYCSWDWEDLHGIGVCCMVLPNISSAKYY